MEISIEEIKNANVAHVHHIWIEAILLANYAQKYTDEIELIYTVNE